LLNINNSLSELVAQGRSPAENYKRLTVSNKRYFHITLVGAIAIAALTGYFLNSYTSASTGIIAIITSTLTLAGITNWLVELRKYRARNQTNTDFGGVSYRNLIIRNAKWEMTSSIIGMIIFYSGIIGLYFFHNAEIDSLLSTYFSLPVHINFFILTVSIMTLQGVSTMANILRYGYLNFLIESDDIVEVDKDYILKKKRLLITLLVLAPILIFLIFSSLEIPRLIAFIFALFLSINSIRIIKIER